MKRPLLSFVVLAVLLSSAGLVPASAALVANSDQACLIRVTAPDAVSGDALGGSIAISHETMVVTADGTLGGPTRSAYVYARSAGGWTMQQKIGFNGQKPQCVAIDGDTLAVGLTPKSGYEGHALQIWMRINGTWRVQSSFDFGANMVGSIAIDGDTIAVGSPLLIGPPDTEIPGSVSIFVRQGLGWTLQQKVGATPGQGYDSFGNSVDLEGDRLVVGAPGENSPARCAGAVYVYGRTGTSWSEQARLVTPDAVAFDSLGTSVILDGDQIASGTSGWSSQTGAVDIWRYDGASWTSRQRVVAPDGRPGNLVDYGGDGFGNTLAIAGDTLVVGAQGDDDKGTDSGSVYVLRRVDGTWVHQRKIVAPDGSAGDGFGSKIAVDSGRVVVGVRSDDSPARDAGSVYAFDLGYVTPADTTLTVEAGGILVNDVLPVAAGGTAAVAGRSSTESLSTACGSLGAALANLPVVVSTVKAPTRGDLSMGEDAAFTYTPAHGWKGADRFEYSFSDGTATSNAAAVTVETWQPTTLRISAGDTSPRYGGSTTLKAKVTTIDGAPMVGRLVVFEVLVGTRWLSLGSDTAGSTGLATRAITGLTVGRSYRARTVFSSVYGAAGSSILRVVPHVSVSVPSVPASAARNQVFSVTGSLKPRHSLSGHPVQLQFYLFEAGAWVLKKTVTPTLRINSSYAKYSASVPLDTSGRWKVRAIHLADGANSGTASGYRYLTVR